MNSCYGFDCAGVASKKETTIHIAWTLGNYLSWDLVVSNQSLKCLMTASRVSSKEDCSNQ